ncbi:MAG: TRAP transporter substrate-binding protein [Firmicutes bacterium]|nr:TRAP transporter substrate-binding protein [Bacillota bacterium]
MKIKIKMFFLVAALIALPVFGGCAPKTTAPPQPEQKPAKTWNLQFATFWPATDFMVAEGHKAWAEEIKKRTNGQVNITFHPGEALLKAKEIYEGVAKGAADIGSTCPSYTPGKFPVTEALELPGYKNDNALVASMTAWEAYKTMDLMQKEYKDVKVLMFWATGPGDVMTKSPVNKLEDLKGMQIRAVGGTVPTMKALGATPVSMPMSEAYLALQQGTVKGILAPNDTLKGFKLAEVLSHVTKTPFLYNIVFIKVMNLNTWNSLPPDIQKVITEVSEEFVEKYGKLRTDHTKAGLDYGVKERNIKVIQLDAQEQAKWLKQVEPVVGEWIQKTEKANLPGKDIVNKVKEIDARMSQKYSGYGK